MAVWQQLDGSSEKIFSNHYTKGTGWDNALLIDSGLNSDKPQITVDRGGDVIAVWRRGAAIDANCYY